LTSTPCGFYPTHYVRLDCTLRNVLLSLPGVRVGERQEFFQPTPTVWVGFGFYPPDIRLAGLGFRSLFQQIKILPKET